VTIHTGPNHPSYVMLPVVPPKSAGKKKAAKKKK
jgi:hypothetical protein